MHLILPQITALENSWQVLMKMALWAVGMAITVQALSYLGSGYLLQQTLAIAQQRLSLTRSTLIVLGAGSISLIAAYLQTTPIGLARENIRNRTH